VKYPRRYLPWRQQRPARGAPQEAAPRPVRGAGPICFFSQPGEAFACFRPIRAGGIHFVNIHGPGSPLRLNVHFRSESLPRTNDAREPVAPGPANCRAETAALPTGTRRRRAQTKSCPSGRACAARTKTRVAHLQRRLGSCASPEELPRRHRVPAAAGFFTVLRQKNENRNWPPAMGGGQIQPRLRQQKMRQSLAGVGPLRVDAPSPRGRSPCRRRTAGVA